MNLEEKKRQVEAFVETDRQDYVSFLNSLEDRKIDWVSNDQHKQEFLEENPLPDYSQEWLNHGIYGELVDQPRYRELDFEKFSYSVMKAVVDDEETVETMKAIMSVPRSYQRKKLRVYLFECMKKPSSPYYNIEKYREVLQKMIDAKHKVEEIIDTNGYDVLTKTFDSFGFLASREEAEQLQEKVNEQLEITSMDLETYESVVSFYNVGLFKEVDGEWGMVKTGGTKYDNVKEAIAHHLTSLEFNKAHQEVSKALRGQGDYEGQQFNSDKLKEYNSVLTQIKNSEDYRVRG